MTKYFLTALLFLFVACKQDNTKNNVLSKQTEKPQLTEQQAYQLSQLPLSCIPTEYPNKPGMVLSAYTDFDSITNLHPAFYGCFDWHSAVHGHWSLVKIAKLFPTIENYDTITQLLASQLSKENILAEVAYFERETEYGFERTYGWAWLLKLAEELYTWDSPLGKQLYQNITPLASLIVERYHNYLPKLVYPIRTGEHPNTAFGLSFAWDYAHTTNNTKLQTLIEKTALKFYLNDKNCPITWEPGGHDFLSPCLEEMNIMRRVLNNKEFNVWLIDFLPELSNAYYQLEPAQVSDRSDGKLVHLDGLNFSRAWCLLGVANQNTNMDYLRKVAYNHINYSLPKIFEDAYEGGHWLGSFALYALSEM